jgi:hypothetical protein
VLGFFPGILPGKIQEVSRKILENPGRFQEDPGNSKKIMEILGRKFFKIILERFNIYYVLFYKLHIIIFFFYCIA